MATKRGNSLPKPVTEAPLAGGATNPPKKATESPNEKPSPTPIIPEFRTTIRPRVTNILSNGQMVINGIEFFEKPAANYRMHSYRPIIQGILDGKIGEVDAYRQLCQQDLWFLTYFVLGNVIANDDKGHWVKMCRMIDEGPKTMTLDMWAREHGKTSLLTINRTIQDLLNDPRHTVAIISYSQNAAVVFFKDIKNQFELNEDLKMLFPDIIWEKPPHRGVSWSDAGITLRRPHPMKECSVEAWGLLEGMPTGRHFSIRRYDDISTFDIAQSPNSMRRMKDAFQMSMNIGKDGDVVNVTGTPYHYDDVLMDIKKMTKRDGSPLYHTRMVTATDDGTVNGKSIYLSDERMELLKRNRKFFNSQQLLDPTPEDEVKLPYSMINIIRKDQLPSNLLKVMVIDPAGQKAKDKIRQDAWGIWVLGMERNIEDHGSFNVYIVDGLIARLRHEEMTRAVVNLYTRNMPIRLVGVEKFGASSAEIHVSNALRSKGHVVTIENGRLKALSPRGGKAMRIESLATPLYNGAIFMLEDVNEDTRGTLREEMEKYPAWHDDGLDALAMGFELFKDPQFSQYVRRTGEVKEEKKTDRWERAWGKVSQSSSMSWMGR